MSIEESGTRELRQAARRFGALIGLLVIVIVAGSVGFAIVEGTSLAFGFVWTLDTITTLGTVRAPHDAGGRVIVIGLEVLGIGTLGYGLATVSEFFVSGQLSGALELRRNHRMIDSYSDHYIVCGYGRVGRQVARDLHARGAEVVVIDANPAHREVARVDEIAFIDGQAADDDVLLRAGIKRATAVLACVDSDAENIFVALSARELRANVMIIARASAEEAEKKLRRAGANRVISPYKTTGSEMARIALHPQIAGAVEVADYRVEQIEVPPECAGLGRSVADVRGNTVIIALRRSDGTFAPQPSPEETIVAGDTLIALGTPPELERLESLFQPTVLTSDT